LEQISTASLALFRYDQAKPAERLLAWHEDETSPEDKRDYCVRVN
jgi:hypothetical protein